MARGTITLNGKQFEIANNNELSGLSTIFMAKAFQGWNGSQIHYDALSKEDAKLLAESGSEALDGILSGISDIANLIGFVDFEDKGITDKVSNAFWLLGGLAELALNTRHEYDNLKTYANS